MSQYRYFHSTYHTSYLLCVPTSPTYVYTTYDYLLLELTEGNYDFSNRQHRESNPQPRKPDWPVRNLMYQANQACWNTAFESDMQVLIVISDKWWVKNSFVNIIL